MESSFFFVICAFINSFDYIKLFLGILDQISLGKICESKDRNNLKSNREILKPLLPLNKLNYLFLSNPDFINFNLLNKTSQIFLLRGYLLSKLHNLFLR